MRTLDCGQDVFVYGLFFLFTVVIVVSFGALLATPILMHLEARKRARPTVTALELAQRFHELYEQLAPQYGYETREDTRQFDARSPNGQLMKAVCRRMLHEFDEPLRWKEPE